MQVLAILNKQRSANATAPARSAVVAYAGVTGPQLYEAFMACPDSLVAAPCTQAFIDRIVVAHVNLFSGEPYANGNNLATSTSSSQARRMLPAGSNTGEITIGATVTDGADLNMTLTKPLYFGTVAITSLPDAQSAETGCGTRTSTSAGNIFATTAIAALAALVMTLN